MTHISTVRVHENKAYVFRSTHQKFKLYALMQTQYKPHKITRLSSFAQYEAGLPPMDSDSRLRYLAYDIS